MIKDEDTINIFRIIEGVFVSTLFKRARSRRIVNWAPEGVPIPLKCKSCGAVFVTRNKGSIRRNRIYFGDDYNKCERCDKLGHGDVFLAPDILLYARGRWK